mmetsp:Transcript_28554/g.28318  ORF Transcript_28554/g.28318 Transcript_28554/m.28318 type:complete len:105 (+) Transcript_28554:133-447(+)
MIVVIVIVGIVAVSAGIGAIVFFCIRSRKRASQNRYYQMHKQHQYNPQQAFPTPQYQQPNVTGQPVYNPSSPVYKQPGAYNNQVGFRPAQNQNLTQPQTQFPQN